MSVVIRERVLQGIVSGYYCSNGLCYPSSVDSRLGIDSQRVRELIFLL